MADKEDKKAERAPSSSGADKAPNPKAERAAKAKADAAARAAAPKGEREPEPKEPARLHKHFDDVIRAKLTEQFGYKNRMEVPRVDKIVLNMGVGDAVNDRKKVDVAAADLSMIAGQKAVVTHARKSIATYKLREGQAIGCKVTLRRRRMYEFLDRLVNVALPRVRDFRGLNPEELRRPRQLHARHQGTHHFPRDRLRQGGVGAGDGYRRLHDGEERRGSPRIARGIRFSVPAVSRQQGLAQTRKG